MRNSTALYAHSLQINTCNDTQATCMYCLQSTISSLRPDETSLRLPDGWSCSHGTRSKLPCPLTQTRGIWPCQHNQKADRTPPAI